MEGPFPRLSTHSIVRRYYGVWLAYSLAGGFLGGVYPLFLRARGLNQFEINSVLAVYFAVAFLFDVPTGAFADAPGRRRSFMVVCLLRCLALASRRHRLSPERPRRHAAPRATPRCGRTRSSRDASSGARQDRLWHPAGLRHSVDSPAQPRRGHHPGGHGTLLAPVAAPLQGWLRRRRVGGRLGVVRAGIREDAWRRGGGADPRPHLRAPAPAEWPHDRSRA